MQSVVVVAFVVSVFSRRAASMLNVTGPAMIRGDSTAIFEAFRQ